MNSVLTLTEYLNQGIPAYMPIVRLNENEYEVKETYTHRKGHPEAQERRLIKINQYPEATYMQRGNDRQLYAVKKDDTCDSHSCFWI